jgi:flagellar motor switch/type III secretory pathway protein FliN
MTVSPFPFAQLDSVTASEARAERAIRAYVGRAIDLTRLRDAASDLGLGDVELLLRRVRKTSRPRGSDDFVGVALATSDDATLGGSMLLELEGALAAALARRALKRPPTRVFDASRAPPPELVGGVAALARARGRRAYAEQKLRVVAAGPGAGLFGDLLRAAGGEVYTLSFAVMHEHEAFEARVSLARGVAEMSPEAPWGKQVLTSLGATPLALRVVWWTVAARARDVADLSPGDAFMLGALGQEAAGERTLSAELSPRGRVELLAPRSEVGLLAHVSGPESLVFDGALTSASWSEATAMKEDTGKTDVALADAPVVVRVEIGAAEMAAREWASLGKGDVIALRKRLGEAVTLRVSGVEVARGELVQIDGEVGVRILERVTP